MIFHCPARWLWGICLPAEQAKYVIIRRLTSHILIILHRKPAGPRTAWRLTACQRWIDNVNGELEQNRNSHKVLSGRLMWTLFVSVVESCSSELMTDVNNEEAETVSRTRAGIKSLLHRWNNPRRQLYGDMCPSISNSNSFQLTS